MAATYVDTHLMAAPWVDTHFMAAPHVGSASCCDTHLVCHRTHYVDGEPIDARSGVEEMMISY